MNVTDMAIHRLIQQGKRDPGDITDLLLADGYARTFTPEEMVKATADCQENWRDLGLPSGGEPETSEQVIGCYLNDIVDEALSQPGATSASIATAVTAAGFRKGDGNE